MKYEYRIYQKMLRETVKCRSGMWKSKALWRTLPLATAEVAISSEKDCPSSAGAATAIGFVPSSACAWLRAILRKYLGINVINEVKNTVMIGE